MPRTNRHKLPELHLRKADPVLGAAIRNIDLRPGRRTRPEGYFRSLVEAILSQQISGKAADSILARFRALYPGIDFPDATMVLKTSDAKLRGAGVSRQKAGYLKSLSRAVASGKLNLRDINGEADEQVIASLTQVKGIGRWTAEMFLIFCLRRPDIFSIGDLGLQNAVKKLYKLKRHPDKKKLERLSAAWKPYRSTASRYLWAFLDN